MGGIHLSILSTSMLVHITCKHKALIPQQFTLLQQIPFVSEHVYTMGKTSKESRFNIPGRIGWITMEVPGTIALLYCMITIPAKGITSLPMGSLVLGGLFATHYLNRAVIGPIISPSMAPMSPLVWLFALTFQLMNGISIGGWLAGYGSSTHKQSKNDTHFVSNTQFQVGVLIWVLGLVGNIWHDDELREIRRIASREQKQKQKEEKDGNQKIERVYKVPENGLFRWILFPHYLCEWIEWAGFWLASGKGCTPARTFLLNEITTMLPRALQGKEWYEKKFGKEKIAGRTAVIPGLL